ncbi:tetratricopeptide repeat 28-like, partial [Paramuricea clavata]
ICEQIEKSRTDKAWADRVIGLSYCNLGQYKEAIPYLEQCLELEGLRDDEEMEETSELKEDKNLEQQMHQELGYVYTAMNQHETAAEYFQHSLRLAKELGDKAKIATALPKGSSHNSRQVVYRMWRKSTKEASPYYDEAEQIAKSLGDKAMEADSYEGQGNVFHSTSDYDRAIEKHNKSLELAIQIKDMKRQQRAYENLGNSYFALQKCKEMGDYACWRKYRNAVKCHEEEIKIAKDLGNKVREGEALGNLGNAYTGLCEYQKAIELHEESLKIAEDYVVQADERRANGNLGNAYVASGQYRKALDFQRRALEISQQLSHRAAEGRIHESMARAYYLSGHIEKAVESSRKSLRIASEVGDKAGKGRALGTLGNAYMEFGQNKQTAISNLREYLRISKELSNEADKGDALGSMAAVLIEIGQYNKALECCNESLKIAKDLKDEAREGRAYENLGKFYTAIGQYEEAIKTHGKHLNIATKLGDKAEMGRANGNLGNAYNKNDKHENAMKCHTKDKDIAEELGNVARVGRAQGNMGNTFSKLRQFEKAFDCHKKRLSIAEELNDKTSLAEALLGLGEHYINTGQFEKAIQFLYRLHEISTHNYELTAIAQELLGQCYQRHDVLKICTHSHVAGSKPSRLERGQTALLVSDRGKAQALYDLMRKIVHSGMDLCFNYSDPMETLAHDPSSDTSKILFDNSLFNVINSNHADTIISYAFGEKGELHSWVITKEGVFHKSLNIDNVPSMRDYVYRQIKCFKYNINVRGTQEGTLQDVKVVYDFETRACNLLCLMSDNFDSDQKADTCSPLINTTARKPARSTESSPPQADDNFSLQNLYTILIKPIEEYLTGSTLLIVPEGPLFTLPFAALLDPNEHHLCEKYSLEFAPSLHVLDSCLSTLPPKLGPALFVGNPDLSSIHIDLISLPYAEEEVAHCSKHFSAQPLVRHMATKQNVLNRMGSASIIHIAAHGDMNRAEIYLTPNQGEPLIPSSYLLTAEDILKCSLNAQLVVLSCCFSGRGQISAEGVVGTARSFLGSGARAVLVTLWGINDETTKEFMITFYEKLIQEYSVCTAVQQAMMALKGRRYPSRYWAPFQVFGEDIVLTREDIEEIRLMSA